MEANKRILALKAALKLHEKKTAGTLVPSEMGLQVLKSKQHIEWAKELADASITLVKDTQKLLPISATKYPKVLLEIMGDFPSNERVLNQVKENLEKKKCYSNNEYVLEAVVEKITGNSDFKGKNPVDPFCGRKELSY